jgi:hypothetical protein
MHPDVRAIGPHMKELGLHLFGRALINVVFNEMMNPYAHAMGVVHCAQAGELLIKARIAEEHPLLVFESLPKPTEGDAKLELKQLLVEARTIKYSELPNTLWAATGDRIKDHAGFKSFGDLRNSIAHLCLPKDVDFHARTVDYGFKIIEPLVRRWWSVDVVEFMEQYDEDCEEYLIETLQSRKIRFTRLKAKS